MEKIAFVGLGAMGLPMARNLVKKGSVVRGCDTSPKALETLRAAGKGCGSGGRRCCRCRRVAGDGGQCGAVEALPANAIVCLMATCPPGAVEKIAPVRRGDGQAFCGCPFLAVQRARRLAR